MDYNNDNNNIAQKRIWFMCGRIRFLWSTSFATNATDIFVGILNVHYTRFDIDHTMVKSNCIDAWLPTSPVDVSIHGYRKMISDDWWSGPGGGVSIQQSSIVFLCSDTEGVQFVFANRFIAVVLPAKIDWKRHAIAWLRCTWHVPFHTTKFANFVGQFKAAFLW